jgi:hypothetical protein
VNGSSASWQTGSDLRGLTASWQTGSDVRSLIASWQTGNKLRGFSDAEIKNLTSQFFFHPALTSRTECIRHKRPANVSTQTLTNGLSARNLIANSV